MVKKYCSWFDSVLKTNPRTYEVEYLNGETTTWSIYEKEFVLRELYMSDYPKADSCIRHKVKIVLDLSNYPTKKITTWSLLVWKLTLTN